MYAIKQMKDYLLWHKLQLLIDHAPLQWLSSLKLKVHLLVGSSPTLVIKHGYLDALSQRHSDHNNIIGRIAQTVSEHKHQQLLGPVLCQQHDALLQSRASPSW